MLTRYAVSLGIDPPQVIVDDDDEDEDAASATGSLSPTQTDS